MKIYYQKVKYFLPALAVALVQDQSGGSAPPISDNLNYFGSAAGLPNVDLMSVLINIIRIALGFIGIVMVVMIIYAGFLWMVSGGNDEQRAKARSTIMGAIIGLIIILAANSIVQFVIGAVTGATGAGTPPTP